MKMCIEFLFKFHILKSGVNDWKQKEVHLILSPSAATCNTFKQELHNPEGYVCVWGGGGSSLNLEILREGNSSSFGNLGGGGGGGQK